MLDEQLIVYAAAGGSACLIFGTDFTLDAFLDTTFLLRVHQLVTP